MRIGEFFRNRRIEKKLSLADVAAAIRPDFEESLLWDFEAGDDEDIDGWPLGDYKRYCEVLTVGPTKYAELALLDMCDASLAELITKRREEKQLTRSALSDAIGYEEGVIEAIESGQHERYACLDVLKWLAKELDIPLKSLLERI